MADVPGDNKGKDDGVDGAHDPPAHTLDDAPRVAVHRIPVGQKHILKSIFIIYSIELVAHKTQTLTAFIVFSSKIAGNAGFLRLGALKVRPVRSETKDRNSQLQNKYA